MLTITSLQWSNKSYTGFLLQRQLNPAELICKLALVDGLQEPEIIGVYPNLHCHQTQSMEKALQPLCDCAVAIIRPSVCLLQNTSGFTMDTATKEHLLRCFVLSPEKSLLSSKNMAQSNVLLGLTSKICSLEQGWQGGKYLKPCFRETVGERGDLLFPLWDRQMHEATFFITYYTLLQR